VARVVALVPDLLLGSNVLGMLRAAGHEASLVAGPDDAEAAVGGADVLVVDLASGDVEPAALLGRLRDAGLLAGVRTLAFYSHVDAATRAAAQDAGFDLVVPRSRMAREGPALVDRLL
jgi:hypothetical protein